MDIPDKMRVVIDTNLIISAIIEGILDAAPVSITLRKPLVSSHLKTTDLRGR